jgi:hypothetical protein
VIATRHRRSGEPDLPDDGTQKKDGDDGKENQTESQIACANFVRRTSFLWIPGHAEL